MKRGSDRTVLFALGAAGFSSVAAQLVLLREFLAVFEGNEFVIALTLLAWLISSGMGSLVSLAIRGRTFRALSRVLGLTAGVMAFLPSVLILLVRFLKNTLFVQGSSVGFYPTLAFAFGTIAPYALLAGFFFPCGLFVLRAQGRAFPASTVYALDCGGAATGGLCFSLVLVHLFTPLGTLCVVNTALMLSAWLLFASGGMNRISAAVLPAAALLIVLAGVAFERASISPRSGELVTYRESYFGRIVLTKDAELYTVFIDGVPALSGQDKVLAEEACHYALAQVPRVKRVLLVSSVAGIMEETAKYRPEAIDYAQLDPGLIDMETRYGLMKPAKGLRVIRQDARAWLKSTGAVYDAVIVNYPEPKTFQINRYFTVEFMRLAKAHLSPGGVLAFSVQGYEAYLSSSGRLQVSSLYNTAREVFPHVLILPGQRTYFIAGMARFSTDIPGLLAVKGIKTEYIGSYFAGDISPERISGLMRVLDPLAGVNRDLRPYLMRIAYEGWFAQYSSYPHVFLGVLGIFFMAYLSRLKPHGFVLFTTGCVDMGSEILTIFCFQILFGFLYVKLSLIITVFLAGLIPGALFGGRISGGTRRGLLIADGLMLLLLLLLSGALAAFPQGLEEWSFYVFAFLISVLCGFEFPLVAGSGGNDRQAAGAFSSDLVGAALGTVLVSALLIPFFGIVASCAVLIAMKTASIIVLIGHGKDHSQTVPAL